MADSSPIEKLQNGGECFNPFDADWIDPNYQMIDPRPGVVPYFFGDLLHRPAYRPVFLHELAGIGGFPLLIQHINLDTDHPAEGQGIAARLDACGVHSCLEIQHLVDIVAAISVPQISIPGHDAHHSRAIGADQNRRSVPARTPRPQLAISGRMVCALEVDITITQESVNDLHRFLEATDPVVERKPKGIIFRLMPAGAKTQDKSPATDLVDGVCHLGNQGRVAKAGAGNERRDFDALCGGGQGGKQRPDIPRPLGMHTGKPKEQMIGQPDGVEPDLVYALGNGQNLFPANRFAAPGPLEVWNEAVSYTHLRAHE